MCINVNMFSFSYRLSYRYIVEMNAPISPILPAALVPPFFHSAAALGYLEIDAGLRVSSLDSTRYLR